MKKVFSILTFIIISLLMLTGCNNKEEKVENKTDNSSINLEAENKDFEESKITIDTITSKGNLNEELSTSLDNINKIIEDSKITNDKKIESLKQELDGLNTLKESGVNNENLKEGLNLMIDGVNKQIEFLEGTNEYHKGNKPDDYKEELVSIAYEAIDLLLAAEIIIK